MLRANRIYQTDALRGLRKLNDESVDMVITSPPYWQQRDYHVDGQLGLEDNFQDYIDHLLGIFDEVKRVLKKEGSCWVNLGDVYRGSRIGVTHARHTKGPRSILLDDMSYLSQKGHARRRWSKCLLGLPERFMLEMIQRGWTLRNKIIWHKTNAMPESVKDRLSTTWEVLLFFTKSKRYHFDLDAVREPHLPKNLQRIRGRWKGHREPGSKWQGMEISRMCHPLGKNPGDCWSIPTQGFPGKHFAVYPERLCERPILAGCPKGGLVLEPFMGSGTTAVVAKRLGRRFLGFEINPEYVKMARVRVRRAQELGTGRTAPN